MTNRCSWIDDWEVKEGKKKQWWSQVCGEFAEFMRDGYSFCEEHVGVKNYFRRDHKWLPIGEEREDKNGNEM